MNNHALLYSASVLPASVLPGYALQSTSNNDKDNL